MNRNTSLVVYFHSFQTVEYLSQCIIWSVMSCQIVCHNSYIAHVVLLEMVGGLQWRLHRHAGMIGPMLRLPEGLRPSLTLKININPPQSQTASFHRDRILPHTCSSGKQWTSGRTTWSFQNNPYNGYGMHAVTSPRVRIATEWRSCIWVHPGYNHKPRQAEAGTIISAQYYVSIGTVRVSNIKHSFLWHCCACSSRPVWSRAHTWL